MCKSSRLVNFHTAQKMKFSIANFFSKCDQIRSFLRIWLHLLEKSVMENFIFCAVSVQQSDWFVYLDVSFCLTIVNIIFECEYIFRNARMDYFFELS